MTNTIGYKLQEVLFEELKELKDKKVALFLSGGAGSVSLLAVLKKMNVDVTTYTFAIKGHTSTDLEKAEEYANYFNVEHKPIFLPDNVTLFKEELLFLIQDKQFKLKTDIECGLPFYYAFPEIKEEIIVSGLGDDIYFGLTKKAQIHYRDSLEQNNDYRLKQLKKYRNQKQLIDSLSQHKHVAPFQSNRVYEYLSQFTFDELNYLKNKQVLLDISPSVFEKIRPYKSSLQLGDSKIADMFKPLVHSNWNKNGYKSVVGIYNSISRGEITKDTELKINKEEL